MMRSQENTKQHIVIVGGGMVGVSLALMLAKQLDAPLQSGELALTLIERHAKSSKAANTVSNAPSFDERSTALNRGSAAILDSIGCWQGLQGYAEAIQTVHVSDRGHFAGTHLQAQDFSLDALGYVVENRCLGQSLMTALEASSVTCLAPANVSQCVARKQGYALTVDVDSVSTESVNLMADLLIIADGSESALSQLLGIRTRISDYGQTALIANVALEKPHQGKAYERFTDDGPMALLPLAPVAGENRAALVWTLANTAVAEVRECDPNERLRRLQKAFGYRAGEIRRLGDCHYYPLKRTEAIEQARSHLVLVGNAAHFLHPVAGQGFNLALRDCIALVECLQEAYNNKRALGQFATLRAYLRRQLPDQVLTISLTHQLVSLFSSPRMDKSLLRQLGLMGMNALPPIKDRFARQMMGSGEALW